MERERLPQCEATQMKHILDVTVTDLAEWLVSNGHPKYRAEQILDWIYRQGATGFDEMSNLPKDLRQALVEEYQVLTSSVATHTVAEDGTEKLLLQLGDRGQIECVLLRDDGLRRSICISTQVGCAMGCVFCASGLDGVDRNLTTGEIVEQMLRLQKLLPEGERLSHIVVMGMGEPLANIDQLLPALELASHPKRLGIAPRRITISTVGIPSAMQKLTQRNTRYNLAISLHAPNDELRNQLVPVNKSTGLDAILKESDQYFEKSGRRLTFEYVLLAGMNDSVEHARQLARLLRGRAAMLNVIPYNPVAGLPYRTPSDTATKAFRDTLLQHQVNVRFRRRKGDKINAACGQLRRSQPIEITLQ
jgi:23S rRNA (adenine2503-C2)-methyltransferase